MWLWRVEGGKNTSVICFHLCQISLHLIKKPSLGYFFIFTPLMILPFTFNGRIKGSLRCVQDEPFKQPLLHSHQTDVLMIFWWCNRWDNPLCQSTGGFKNIISSSFFLWYISLSFFLSLWWGSYQAANIDIGKFLSCTFSNRKKQIWLDHSLWFRLYMFAACVCVFLTFKSTQAKTKINLL